MTNLTHSEARRLIDKLHHNQTKEHGISILEEKYLAALEIAMTVLEQQESQCQKCGGTGMADSGGTQPWGEQILVECDCQFEQQENDGDIFIVMRNPGKVPDIKRPVGDVADYLLQLYQHNPDAVCDVVTYRFSGASGQWVQDGRELLAMLEVTHPSTTPQIDNDGGKKCCHRND